MQSPKLTISSNMYYMRYASHGIVAVYLIADILFAAFIHAHRERWRRNQQWKIPHHSRNAIKDNRTSWNMLSSEWNTHTHQIVMQFNWIRERRYNPHNIRDISTHFGANKHLNTNRNEMLQNKVRNEREKHQMLLPAAAVLHLTYSLAVVGCMC